MKPSINPDDAPKPWHFPIGSIESRAAMRAMLNPDAEATERELELCKKSFERFLFGHVWTKDEHSGLERSKYPDKPYLREYVKFLLANRMTLTLKSRQVMATWTLAALYTWDAMFHDSRLNFVQSQKEEGAARIVDKCAQIWERLPDYFRNAYHAEHTYAHLRFYKPGQERAYSEIWGVPEGEHQIRSNTGSALLCDEAAFLDFLDGAIGAAKPMLTGGGRMDIVSSANPGYFEDLCAGRVR